MANDLTGRPWILDTADALHPVQMDQTVQPLNRVSTARGTTEQMFKAHVTGFVLRDYVGPGAIAQIMDGIRNIIVAELMGNTTLSPVSLTYTPTHMVIWNLTLVRLDSGKLEVETE